MRRARGKIAGTKAVRDPARLDRKNYTLVADLEAKHLPPTTAGVTLWVDPLMIEVTPGGIKIWRHAPDSKYWHRMAPKKGVLCGSFRPLKTSSIDRDITCPDRRKMM